MRIHPPPTASPVRRYLRAVGELFVFASLFLAVELADRTFFDNNLFDYGIRRGDFAHWYRLFFAPFLHTSWAHVTGNVIGLVLLGSMVAVLGRHTLATVTFAAIAVGGLGVLFFGSPGVHGGASTIVYGYFGFLVTNALYCRQFRSLALCALALLFFHGLARGMLPNGHPGTSISWHAHLFGALGGLSAASLRAREKRPQSHTTTPHIP